jgi:antitoxin (DNA-binding transcriptional repressor) of toxin-antitoxin stability system
MKTVEIAKATAPLADYARDVDKEPVIVTKGGRLVAALMPRDASAARLDPDQRRTQVGAGPFALKSGPRKLKVVGVLAT